VTKCQARNEEIERALAIAIGGFQKKHFEQFSVDHLVNQLAKNFERFSSLNQFRATAFVIGLLVADATVAEMKAAAGRVVDSRKDSLKILGKISFSNWRWFQLRRSVG
jgi:hypothetical protein